ncbi:MAG: polysaccharide pyruvyl transferase family protein [Candidatus Paceibacterota bacterium]|jgi:hypothetical protein
MKLSNIFIGFDIYGAGNVGDDLTLGGFLHAFPGNSRFKISCILPKQRIGSQEKRFPQIDWLPSEDAERRRKEIIADSEYWLGVGDTPFQATGGNYFLNKIYSDIQLIKQKKYMVGVGCEEEVLKEKNLAEEITKNIDYIWTRDEASKSILVDRLKGDPNKISVSGDLANIALRNIFLNNAPKDSSKYALGLLYFSESLEGNDLHALKKFMANFIKKKNVAFIGNETRKLSKYEYFIYKLLFWDSIIMFRKAPDYYMPDYKNADLSGLVSHFNNYDVVMASRYHAILTAAWAGCRLVALDRSSKIRFLSKELGIPLVKKPFNESSLWDGYRNAKSVPRDLLMRMARGAEKAVLDFYNHLSTNQSF